MVSGTKKPSWVVALGVLLAFALVLRAVFRSPELLSSDAADLAAETTRLLCSDKTWHATLKRLVFFRLGGVQPLVVFSQGFLAKWWGHAMNPTTWESSTILVGLLPLVFAFLLGRRLGGPRTGYVWALLLTVSPIHIMLGRNLGAPWVYEQGFQLALIWLADRYLTAPARASSGPFYATLAAYLWCGNQMLGIFPVLAYVLAAHASQQAPAARFRYVARKVFTWWALLFAASLVYLLYATFALHRGHLYHALFEKRKALGWYGWNFYSDLVHNFGYVPAWLCLVALIFALFAPLGLLDRRRIPLVFALSYVLPFVFLVNRGTTLTRGYCVYGLTGLLGLLALLPLHLEVWWRRRPDESSAPPAEPTTVGGKGGSPPNRGEVGVFDRLWRGPFRALSGCADRASRVGRASSRDWRRVVVAPPLIAAALLLVGAGASTYRLYSGSLLGVRGFQGAYGAAVGVASAAALVDELAPTLPNPGGGVFSDAYGGSGLEPPVMRLYFDRPIFAKYDAARLTPYQAFTGRADEVDFGVIKPENTKLVAKYFAHLRLAGKIVRDATGEVVLLVYARDYRGPVSEITAESGVKRLAGRRRPFCGG